MREILTIYLDCWKRTLDFRGRSRRRELAVFLIGNLFIIVTLGLLGACTRLSVLKCVPIALGFCVIHVTSSYCPYVLLLLIAALHDLVRTWAGMYLASLSILAVLMFLPYTALTMRRLHDINQSADWVFASWIPIVGVPLALFCFLVLLYQKGDPKPNRFGPDPKARPLNQCPTCFYDLTGNTSGRCPECGNQMGPISVP